MAPGRCPVRPGQQRSSVAEAGEDIAAEAFVRIQPSPHGGMGRVIRLLRDVKRNRTHGPDECPEFEERPVFKRPRQIGRLVRGPEPAPGDQVGVRGDGGCRINLQQGQSVDEVHQVGRPGRVEQAELAPRVVAPRHG